MKKIINIYFLACVLFLLVSSASAYSINYSSVVVGNEFTSPVVGATVESFDAPLLWNWSGDYAVVSGSVSGRYAAPYGVSGPDTSNYVAVPRNRSNGSVTVTGLGGLYNYFGLWWGSVDAYNTLTLYRDGSIVESFTGSVVAPPANGNQRAAATNLYVNFFDLPEFDSFALISTNYAFEADNIAIARVPEPGTLLLFGTGLAGLALYRRRSMNK